jgi:hypothetical protein
MDILGLDRMVDGSLHRLETDSGVVPFRIQDEEFTLLFYLLNGIYPYYSRFVRGIKKPITEKEKKYTGWQEACRKDIERAFGVLKSTWQCLARPFLLHKKKKRSLKLGSVCVEHTSRCSRPCVAH